MAKFCIWYLNAPCFEGDGLTDWIKAPKDGVLAVAQPNHRPGDGDFYYMNSFGKVYSSNSPRSLYRGLIGPIPWKLVDIAAALELDDRIKTGITDESDELYKAAETAARRWIMEQAGCGGDCG